MKHRGKVTILILGLLITAAFPGSIGEEEGRMPNFVIIMCDDMGYGDWSRGGSPTIHTPNLNRMADEGVQMTQFYAGGPVCSPCRSALLTGRNSIRTGVISVFFPDSEMGMSPGEITIAEALKPMGYVTACIGKWHLGDRYAYRPLRQGFDYFYGLLYSNDMLNPNLYMNDELIEQPAVQSTLTKRYTQEAISFMESSKDQPFFLYLPHTMPHVPLAASEEFLGISKRGLYGDVIEEIDWSTGQILDALDRLGLGEDTLVIFTSDNGPWTIKKQDGGSAGLLRGAKGDTWEGGMREPFIARWKGRLPAGVVCTEVGSVIDLFPTCVKLAGGAIPTDRPIDGTDLMPALEGKEFPERTIFYYGYNHLTAVRKGKWKLHFAYYDHSKGGYAKITNWVIPDTPLLFDLEADPSERFDLSKEHPEVVDELTQTAERYKEEISSNAENQDLIDWFIYEQPFSLLVGMLEPTLVSSVGPLAPAIVAIFEIAINLIGAVAPVLVNLIEKATPVEGVLRWLVEKIPNNP